MSKKVKMKELVIVKMMQFMEQGIAFTSVELCNHIRSENPDVPIRMKDISKAIRKNILEVSTNRTFQYEVTFITVDSEKATLAYLYHPKGYDVDSYLCRDLVSLKTLKYK